MRTYQTTRNSDGSWDVFALDKPNDTICRIMGVGHAVALVTTLNNAEREVTRQGLMRRAATLLETAVGVMGGEPSDSPAEQAWFRDVEAFRADLDAISELDAGGHLSPETRARIERGREKHGLAMSPLAQDRASLVNGQDKAPDGRVYGPNERECMRLRMIERDSLVRRKADPATMADFDARTVLLADSARHQDDLARAADNGA